MRFVPMSLLSDFGASARLLMRYTTAPLRGNNGIANSFSDLNRHILPAGSETLSMTSLIEIQCMGAAPRSQILLLELAGALMDAHCECAMQQPCGLKLIFFFRYIATLEGIFEFSLNIHDRKTFPKFSCR